MTSNPFWTSPIYGVIKAMKASGNQRGVIAQWMGLAGKWAMENDGPEAAAIRAWLPHFKSRPFYSAAELAPMFPALIVALGLAERPVQYSPGRLAYELSFGGLPYKDFEHPISKIRTRFFIVEQVHHWSKQPLDQRQFEEIYYD